MIYCIGDSFTYGDELQDRALAWPTQLGNLLNIKTVNLGVQASSNTRIVKRAMDITLKTPGDKIIVAWSSITRLETVDKLGFFNYWPGRNIDQIHDYDRKKLVKLVTSMATTETTEWAHRKWLREIILLQTFFKQHNQEYLMIMSHNSQWYNDLFLLQSNIHADLGQHVDPTFFLGWPGTGMIEWIGNSPRGKHGHFLEEGHTKVAEKIYEHTRNIGWVS